MAKINVVFDTKSKELTVDMDGKTMENVQGINISKGGYYSDSEEFSVGLVCLDKKDDEGYKTYTQIIARETSQGKELLTKGAGTFKDNAEFVSLSGVSPKVHEDIFKFLSRKK